jgi:hypothetical protein
MVLALIDRRLIGRIGASGQPYPSPVEAVVVGGAMAAK